jgi:hypothetical protein
VSGASLAATRAAATAAAAEVLTTRGAVTSDPAALVIPGVLLEAFHDGAAQGPCAFATVLHAYFLTGPPGSNLAAFDADLAELAHALRADTWQYVPAYPLAGAELHGYLLTVQSSATFRP